MNDIVTDYGRKPGPGCDWSAHRKDYDGAPDSNDPIGTGNTEAEAIAKLLELEDMRDG